MKYIRTKDGIYERIKVVRQIDEEGNEIAVLMNGVFAPIIKQADTIEELCDEFVWDEDLCYINFENKTLELKRDDYKFDLDYCLKDSSPIYGSIWTDKGLIYVAKMNEKGELELL